MTIQAHSPIAFQSLARVARSSIATPPWFAAPVDAHDDDDAVTLVFHAPEESCGPVRIEVSDEALTLLGRAQAIRLCALPCAVIGKVQVSRAGDLLRVRLPKKRSLEDKSPSNPIEERGTP